jgi:fatty acid desaturase
MSAGGTGWLEHFTTDEIRELRAIREHRAWLTLLVNYGLIGAAMALVAYRPNVLTVVLALCIIGTRQLGLAVLMHESAHYTLFKNRSLNDFVGNWLTGYPIYLSAGMYRVHHLEHHAKTWTEHDPDLPLANKFPVSKASMAREPAIRMVIGTVVTNLILFGVLWALGQPMLYLLWLGAWLTTNKLVARIRSIAEHAVVPDPTDPMGQTRTVRAGWLERLFIAPNRVQYHLEHHLLMTVPHYNLPRFHEMLRARGVLEGACVADGYAQVLRRAIV